ncbi:general stress protein [Knoellia subterranea]|uniref:Membrane protein n=1 Tax=Knoellia subterranea KCTC 19937 TaxID=1385521 RepID=A0A0A0JUT8_9MICO|nr:general stress protein [Knoellia subterranea]KGN39416.1 membrane protein [Knoellia subterranea KCTC 19937]
MSTQPTRGLGPAAAAQVLSLEYPMSLGVHDTYASAQKAVDYLSDHDFPVQNLLIVGTDLKQLERVTGRLTRGRILLGGLLSGAWLGLLIGMIFALFDTSGFSWTSVVATVIFGAVFGAIWALVGYSFTGGQRDFTSITQVVATKYEVLTEHKFAARGRELLAQMDPMAAAQAEAQRMRDVAAQATASTQQTHSNEPPAPPHQV